MKRLPGQVLVSEIHPVNLLLFWFLSFFIRVTVYRLHSACPVLFSTRFKAVDMEKYFSRNASHCFRSQAIQHWENLLKQFPVGSWKVRYDGHLLDFSTKAKQALSGPFERLLLLREIQNQESLTSRPYIVDSLESRYLKGLAPSADGFTYPTLSFFSRINVILDSLFLYISISRRMIIILRAMLYGCLHRNRGQRRPESIPLVWNAVVPYELTLEPDSRSFPWIVDGKYISPNDVLFILPEAVGGDAELDRRFPGFLAFTIPELYRLVPLNILLGCVQNLVMVLVKCVLQLPRGLVTIQKADYLVRVASQKPIVQHFKPACYVTSISDLGIEDPVVVYLNALGIKTVMYSFSATFHHPGDERCKCDFRNIAFANLLVSHVVVWHKDFQEFIEGHPQDQTKVEVIGPLMPGDESVFALPQNDLRVRAGIKPHVESGDPWYISVFDIAPKSRSAKKLMGYYPNFNTEEYMALFLRDMLRLMQDFDRMVLVFKPQRSLKDPIHAYSDDFLESVQGIKESQRGFVLEAGINPWLPMAIADTCIAVPFTVPPLVGMHYGIPGLFHDPTGSVHNRRNKAISHCVTYSYDQLRAKVQALMADGPSRNGDQKATIWSEVQDFIGECPGTSSSDRFRKFLLETGQQ